MKTTKIFHWFRIIGISEGISFILLLGVAMPLKYFAGIPIAVTIIGSIHGILFIAFMVLALEVKINLKKNIKWYAGCFLAAILPFGTFVLDQQLKKEQNRV
jgi:integral membrane protein